MAFVTVLSDFFSCGRARKVRQPSIGPLDDNDATSEPAAHETAEAAAPTLGLTPIPALALDEKAANEADARAGTKGHDADRVANAQQQDVKPAWTNRYYGSAVDKETELSVVQEKAKPSAGWMVEQRVLVTAMHAAAPKDAEKKTSVPEPETETNIVTPPVRCPTPEQEPWISTSVARSQTPEPTPEPEASVVSPKLRPVTPEAQIVDVVSIRSATPDILVRPVTPQEQHVTAQKATPDVEPVVQQPAMPEPEEVSVPVSEEIATSVPEPKMVAPKAQAPKAQAPKRTTPLTFLSMPPEVRNRIYEQMSEDGPIRMCRADDAALLLQEGESPRTPRRQFYNLTQVCRVIRKEFLPVYASKTEYIVDLWGQRTHLAEVETLKAKVSMDIDAACFDMEPIDLLPLIRCLIRTGRTDFRFTSTEGVVFRSISEIVGELNKLLPAADGSNKNWLEAVSGPMKRIDLHLFPHDDIRQYYRFRGAEPLVRIVYPSAKSEEWMKRASKSQAYEAYLRKTGLDRFEMHVVIGHASRRTTNEGRLPLDWRMSYQLARQSMDHTPRISMDIAAARMSIDRSPRR